MSGYLLIASEDSFERRETERANQLAVALRRLGHDVTLFLVQNAVLATRSTCARPALRSVLDASVEVLADEFSLRERGIGTTALLAGVQPAAIDVVVERLAAGHKTLWI